MYIYIIIKLLLEAMGLYLNIRLRYFFIFFEIFLIALYIYLLHDNIYLWNSYLFVWSIFWIILFLLYRLIDYIFINRKKIILKCSDGTKEKVKNIILRKRFLDFIYYFVWFLPWNIGYYIYFWLMEHGWYFRVWFVSNRDIFFWKYFKWDSRIFFFRLNRIIFENNLLKYIYIIKSEFIKTFLRFLLVVSWVRLNMKKKLMLEYMLWRLLAFSYLSMFFFYAFEHIQLINKWIIIFILLIEIVLLFFIGWILDILLKKDVLKRDYKYITVLVEFIDINNIFLIIDPLDYSWSQQIKTFFETNGMVWNKILGNSLSLNILYEFMLYINKVTKGYYFYEYNIMTRMKIEKLYKESNIPWDILPRTRYVIMNLRYIQINMSRKYVIRLSYTYKDDVTFYEGLMGDYRLKTMKNMYLTLFEKTYSDISLLTIIFLFRLNLEFNYMNWRSFYYSELVTDNNFIKFEKVINNTYLAKKVVIIKLWLAKISKENPKLLNAAYFLHTFDLDSRLHDMEGHFMLNLLYVDGTPIDVKLSSLKNVSKFSSFIKYKNNFELLSKLLMFEEEAIVWNSDMVKFFSTLELLKSEKTIRQEYVKNMNNFLLVFSKFNINLRFPQMWFNHDIVVQQISEIYGVSFECDLTLDEMVSLDLNVLYFQHKIVIINIELEHEYDDLLEFYFESIELLENAKINE